MTKCVRIVVLAIAGTAKKKQVNSVTIAPNVMIAAIVKIKEFAIGAKS